MASILQTLRYGNVERGLGSNRPDYVNTLDGARRIAVCVKGRSPSIDVETGARCPEREEAAYQVACVLGMPSLVPPTVVRQMPPDWDQGHHSVQLWCQWRQWSFNERESPALADLALLDAVIGNRDRHNGNLLACAPDRIRAIDHGFTFGYDTIARSSLCCKFRDKPLAERHERALRDFLEHRATINILLGNVGLESRAIAFMWERVGALLTDKIYHV